MSSQHKASAEDRLEQWLGEIKQIHREVLENVCNRNSLASAEARCDVEMEKDDLGLSTVQRRVKEWTEHNFPLKVTDEHRRVAQEFLTARLSYEGTGYDVSDDDLAYLIASREGRNHRPLLGACEELGELCHAHLKCEQGIRGTPEEWEAKKKDAIGDVFVYLLDYCNRENLDVEECLSMALNEISQRDWVKFPQDGRTK